MKLKENKRGGRCEGLRGVQRKMVMIPGKEGSLFETAFFLMRNTPECNSMGENELLREADRMICENRKSAPEGSRSLWEGGADVPRRRPRRLLGLLTAFVLGMSAGAGLFWWLSSLL